MAERGVPSALSYLAEDPDQAVKIADRLGYPVVVKPRGPGSAGVLRADSDEDVRVAVDRALTDSVLGVEDWAVPGALVEEYIPGPEISVEAVVLDNPEHVHIAAVTRKSLGPEPQFQEVAHSVDAADPLCTDPVLAFVVTAAVRALGATRAVLHIELRLSPDGPRVIEVNGRPAGDLIPLLVEEATGINLPKALATLAAGGTPDLTPTRADAAAIGYTATRCTTSTAATRSATTSCGASTAAGRGPRTLGHGTPGRVRASRRSRRPGTEVARRCTA